MTRGDLRELALHMIYGWDFIGGDPDQVVKTRLEQDYYEKLAGENELYAQRPFPKQVRYIDTVTNGVSQHVQELNDIIASYSHGWDISRISRLARCVLQLALFEILYLPDVPDGVAVSEAVRLAKKYDGDDTGAFVNGILGAYLRSGNRNGAAGEEAPAL